MADWNSLTRFLSICRFSEDNCHNRSNVQERCTQLMANANTQHTTPTTLVSGLLCILWHSFDFLFYSWKKGVKLKQHSLELRQLLTLRNFWFCGYRFKKRRELRSSETKIKFSLLKMRVNVMNSALKVTLFTFCLFKWRLLFRLLFWLADCKIKARLLHARPMPSTHRWVTFHRNHIWAGSELATFVFTLLHPCWYTPWDQI